MARTPISLKADAAWNRYASTVYAGGTPQQRRFALERAVEADERLAKVELAEQARERRRKSAEALSGH